MEDYDEEKRFNEIVWLYLRTTQAIQAVPPQVKENDDDNDDYFAFRPFLFIPIVTILTF